MVEFGESYFRHYGGHNRPYRNTFEKYCTSPIELRKFLQATGRRFPRSIVDLGAADGSALKLFGKVFSADVLHGVENSTYAFERRIVDNIFLGDMCDFVANRPASFLRMYDLILVNSAMYLRPQQLASFLQSLKTLCHRNTTIVLTLPSYYPSGIYTYLAEFKRSLACRTIPIIRPKPWWIEAAYDGGFEITGDLDGNGLLLMLPRKGFSRPSIFGNPANVAVTYEFDRTRLSAKAAQFRIWHLENELQLNFTHSEIGSPAKFVELGGSRTKAHCRALSKVLPDILAFFRSGKVGRFHPIEFRRLSEPIYVPGTLCCPTRNGFSLRSDANF
jgi:hypothetical protein